MQIQNVTIVVRGAAGEIMKGVFNAHGDLISGDARAKDLTFLSGGAAGESEVKPVDNGGILFEKSTVK